MVSKASGRVLDIAGASTKNGANAQQYHRNGTTAQTFKFTRIDATAGSQVIPNGTYTIVSSLASNKVVDISSASPSNYANVQLYQSNNTNAQKFTFTYKDGFYTITNIGSKKALDVSGAQTYNYANVHQYQSNNTDAQKWKIIKNNDGTYTFIAKCSGKVLDVSAANTANHTNIQQYSSNGTKAQKFTLRKV